MGVYGGIGGKVLSDVEFMFKCAELMISIVGLVFVVFGWIIPYRNSIKKKNFVLRMNVN